MKLTNRHTDKKVRKHNRSETHNNRNTGTDNNKLTHTDTQTKFAKRDTHKKANMHYDIQIDRRRQTYTR